MPGIAIQRPNGWNMTTANRADKRFTGSISVHSRGFGFLNIETDSEQLSAFVVPPDLNPFLASDIVEAQIQESEDGRYSASQLKLVRRSRSVLYGEVTRRKGHLWLKTDKEVANTDWPLDGEAKVGDFVLAQVDGNRAKLACVLEDDADLPLERLIARFDLIEGFDADCERQAKEITKKQHQLGSRRDLRDVLTITIDSPSTTDLDDAVSVLPADSEGAVRLLVSIADPTDFITEGSPLDEEARAKGTSTYLTDRVLPMLPHSLSSQHLSLVPGEDRSCLTVELRIDIEGEIKSVDLYESLIKSDRRVSYSELALWLTQGELSENLEPISDSLPWLRTAASRLSVARDRRGGVKLAGDDTAYATLDEDGNVTGTGRSVSTQAHLLIERFMVAANEAVADWLEKRGFPAVYRVHPTPSHEKVVMLNTTAQQFGFQLGFEGELTPVALAAFDRQISGVSWEPAIRSVLRGILEKAKYTTEAGLHLGLGAPKYLHFTSPLRRYADFMVHRLIRAYLNGERAIRPQAPRFKQLCEHLNYRSMLANKASSARRRMLLAEYIKDRIGEEFFARVTRILPFGLVVQLDESLIEGLLPLESLPDGPWEATATSARCESDELFLGEGVWVRLEAVDPSEGRVEFHLLPN